MNNCLPDDDANIFCILSNVVQLLKAYNLWQEEAPDPIAFTSKLPFFLDTMTAEQWLQWVFLPRCNDLLLNELSLPTNCNIAPYMEEAFKYYTPYPKELIELLKELDYALVEKGND